MKGIKPKISTGKDIRLFILFTPFIQLNLFFSVNLRVSASLWHMLFPGFVRYFKSK
jgi:hypothetical protein